MNAELLALIEAFDTWKESRPLETENELRLRAIYQSRLDDALERHKNLSRQSLEAAVELAHKGWLKAQQKPSAIPPKA